MKATNSHQDQNVLKNRAEGVMSTDMALSSYYTLEIWVCERVWATQTRASLGFSGFDLESVQNIFQMNNKTELVLKIKEKQDPMVHKHVLKIYLKE